jgi:hypothetical protein
MQAAASTGSSTSFLHGRQSRSNCRAARLEEHRQLRAQQQRKSLCAEFSEQVEATSEIQR